MVIFDNSKLVFSFSLHTKSQMQFEISAYSIGFFDIKFAKSKADIYDFY